MTPGSQKFLAMLASLPALLLRAWVLAKLWLWFLVPLGLPAITLAHAFGISTLAIFLIRGTRLPDAFEDLRLTDEEKAKRYLEGVVYVYIGPLFAWGFGAIAYYFM